jgi:hypothetical protein
MAQSIYERNSDEQVSNVSVFNVFDKGQLKQNFS